jgi:hypothetical protein
MPDRPKTLYAITADMQAIEDLLWELETAETQDKEAIAAILAAMQRAEGALADKAERILHVARDYEAGAEAARAESRRLADLARWREARADRLKGALLAAMEATGCAALDAPTCRITRAKTGGKAPLLVDAVAPEAVAEHAPELVKRKLELDRDAIRAALERGEQIPWARLDTEPRFHLRVK